jgi:hypothetical protein
MPPLPSGTVTFLFTDIEGSTRLLQELGAEAYAEKLAEHRRVLRESFARHGGVEVDTEGDAFFVVFARAEDAVTAAAEAQQTLAAGPVRVRMGVHTGIPIIRDADYVGVDVHRAARIVAAGHGGQVVISQATAALLDPKVEVRDLGEHRLKDLREPERLYQLGGGEFPPLKTLYRANLPIQPGPLIGRKRELADVLELLSVTRLVTLTGPGGTGKTRLALQAAAELVEDYRDGVWWVAMAALRDPELVETTIAQVIGARNGLAEHLRPRRALLLLDNLEQVLPASVRIAGLLADAPRVTVLATSRERLVSRTAGVAGAWFEETHSASGNGAGPAPPRSGERVPLDTPAHDAFGHDPEPRLTPALSEPLGAARVVELGGAAHLDPARSPRVDADEIVDHDRDLRVGLQIVVLLRRGEVAAADVDRGPILSEAEADRDHVRRVVRVCGGQAREPLAPQVLEFFVGEGSHRWLVGSRLVSAPA